jgi:hypothetical protein
VCVAQAVKCYRRDARTQNATRRKIAESKIEKFGVLSGVRTPNQPELEQKFGAVTKRNDLIDCTLLFAKRRRVYASA